MENTNDRKLSFPQRNWLLLCILVAILSPLVVHLVHRSAESESYKQSMDEKPVRAGNSTDTSYKVASPPVAPRADSAKK
ncbi:MAG: hypothetical protein P4L51_03205 [Puia sp.]|nr:hypothetical protein [Puia sp.]